MVHFHLRLARARREDGFSLLEVAVAIGIFGVICILMAGVLAGGLKGVHLGKQRTIATADANEVIERARALAFGDVGLVSSDITIASDPRIVGTCPAACTFDGEPVVFAANATGHPLNPHIQTGIERPPTTLSRAIYVTGADTNGDGLYDLRRVTVVVSWERSAVRGVANSVTATTLMSQNSPGTLGNPVLGTTYPPLHGSAVAESGDALVEAEVGANADLDSTSGPATKTLRIVGVSGHGDNTLNANSTLSCSQQTQAIQGLVSTSGTAANAAADSVTNTGPNTDSQTQAESTVGVGDDPLTVTTAMMSGAASCTASGVTSGSTLPSESGSSSLVSLGSSLASSGVGLVKHVASFAPVEMETYAAGQEAAQSNPSARQMDVAATHSFGGLTLLRQFGVGLDDIDLGMPDGVVDIGAYAATAQAMASATTGSQGVDADAAKPLTVRIWDNGSAANLEDAQGNPIACDSHAGSYCTVTPATGEAMTILQDLDLCLPVLLCTQQIELEVFVRINPARTEAITLADGLTKVHKADYSPVETSVRLRVANIGEAPLVDVRVNADMGRIFSCAKYGVYPGGCS